MVHSIDDNRLASLEINNGDRLLIQAGVRIYRGLKSGAIWELHWHTTADKWQSVLEGEIDLTFFASDFFFADKRITVRR